MPRETPTGSEGSGAEETVPDDLAREDLDSVADRLEAALERIARHLEAAAPDHPSAELTTRLDGLIGRLREALGGSPDGTPQAGDFPGGGSPGEATPGGGFPGGTFPGGDPTGGGGRGGSHD